MEKALAHMTLFSKMKTEEQNVEQNALAIKVNNDEVA
jgi:hypothetical protein